MLRTSGWICFAVECGPRFWRLCGVVALSVGVGGTTLCSIRMSFVTLESAYAFLAPAPRQRAKVPEADNAQLVLEREATAELERERVAEFERELAFEMNGDRRPGQEGEETQADIEPTRALRAGSLSLDGCDADPVGEALVIAYEAPSPEFGSSAWVACLAWTLSAAAVSGEQISTLRPRGAVSTAAGARARAASSIASLPWRLAIGRQLRQEGHWLASGFWRLSSALRARRPSAVKFGAWRCALIGGAWLGWAKIAYLATVARNV